MSTSKTILLSNVVKNFIMIWLNLRTYTTIAYYYNAVTGKIDEEKESLKTDFYFMSYFNFIYPNGKIEEYKDTKFKDIKEICDYMTNS